MYNSVLEKHTLASRGIVSESSCPLCKNHPKTICHLLKECTYAQEFWHKISVPPATVNSFTNTKVNSWLRDNCHNKAAHQSSVPWSYVFSFVIWDLWKYRNKVVFDNTTQNPILHRQSISQALEYYYCVGKVKNQRSMVVIPVRWKKPSPNWYKLNTDKASFGNPGKAGGGGIIRDSLATG